MAFYNSPNGHGITVMFERNPLMATAYIYLVVPSGSHLLEPEIHVILTISTTDHQIMNTSEAKLKMP